MDYAHISPLISAPEWPCNFRPLTLKQLWSAESGFSLHHFWGTAKAGRKKSDLDMIKHEARPTLPSPIQFPTQQCSSISAVLAAFYKGVSAAVGLLRRFVPLPGVGPRSHYGAARSWGSSIAGLAIGRHCHCWSTPCLPHLSPVSSTSSHPVHPNACLPPTYCTGLLSLSRSP